MDDTSKTPSAPGWRADPETPERARYWNGESWTGLTRGAPDDSDPAGERQVTSRRPHGTPRRPRWQLLGVVILVAICLGVAVLVLRAVSDDDSADPNEAGPTTSVDTTAELTPAPDRTGPCTLPEDEAVAALEALPELTPLTTDAEFGETACIDGWATLPLESPEAGAALALFVRLDDGWSFSALSQSDVCATSGVPEDLSTQLGCDEP